MRKNKILILSLYTLLIVGCSGGGGSGGTSNEANRQSQEPKPLNLENIETETIILTDNDGSEIARLLVDARDGLSTKDIDLDRDLAVVYKQGYSGIVLSKNENEEWAKLSGIKGETTSAQDIAHLNGKIYYQGSSFAYKENELKRGDLAFIVDLDKKIGYGVINGITDGAIALREGSIINVTSKDTNNSTVGVKGVAEQVNSDGSSMLFGGKGTYEVGIYGKGNEVVGYTEGYSEPLWGGVAIGDGEPVAPKYKTEWKAGFAGKRLDEAPEVFRDKN